MRNKQFGAMIVTAGLGALLALPLPSAAQSDDGNRPTTQQQMMYFRAYVQDAPGCTATVVDGEVRFAGVSAPATCPDTVAWAGWLTSIRDGFWTWAQDPTTWPENPLPLCAEAGQANCCDPAVLDQATPIAGAPNEQCPYSPADWTDPPLLKVERANNHSPTFVDELDPGRSLRDKEVETIFRNASTLKYIFRKNLYSKEGLGARFRAINESLATDVPYHRVDLEVRFPESAILAKADWVHQRDMLEAGLIVDEGPNGEALDPPQNPDFPYVTVYLEGKKPEDSGLYYLVAMTNATKSLPQWHWYAIEHVANPGRCDHIGCNDSFGFQAKGIVVDGQTYGRNYVPPHPLGNPDPDDKAMFPSGYGQTYLPEETGETITAELQALYDGLGIATAETDADPRVLDPADPAWANYRLKGTQTQFTTADGVPTLMGASVTEGGFVNSASCITCHATATTDAYGNPGVPSVGSVAHLNLFGFQQSAWGAPDSAWFYSFGSAVYNAVPIDFVWGILGANCIEDAKDPAEKAKGRCESYENVVLGWPNE